MASEPPHVSDPIFALAADRDLETRFATYPPEIQAHIVKYLARYGGLDVKSVGRAGATFRSLLVPVVLTEVQTEWSSALATYKPTDQVIGAGLDGTVYLGTDPTKVVKVSPLTDRGCFTGRQRLELEYTIARLMGELGVGPTVYEAAIDEKYGYLVMERYESDLDHIIEGQSDEFVTAYRAAIVRLIETMHAAGVVHRDLAYNNILYRVVDGRPDIRLADYAYALFSTDADLRLNDLFRFKGLNPGRNVILTYQGIPCEDTS